MTTTKPSAPTTRLTTPTLNTTGLSAQEIKDRQAVQNAWVGFWSVYVRIGSLPVAKRLAALTPFAIDPIRTQVLNNARDYDAKGLGTYGNVTHRLYWGPSIEGSSTAVMGDCIDTSKYGSEVLATKVKRSHGVVRGKLQGIFKKGTDGEWRVYNLLVFEDQKC